MDFEPLELQQDIEEKQEDESPKSPKTEKVETESDHYMEMYVEGQIKEKIDPLTELAEKLKEDLASLTERFEESTAEGTADQKRIDVHYRDVCKAILLKDGIVIKDLTPMNILQEYRRISAKED